VRENTGRSLAVAGIAALGYAIWAWVLAIMVWIGVTIYAIVKWIGAPHDHPSATTVLVLIVGIVSFWPIAISVGCYAIARSMRRRTAAPALADDA
jgi:polyferredoxin